MTFPLLWHLCYFSNLRENSQVLATIAVHSTTFYISIAVFNSLFKKSSRKRWTWKKLDRLQEILNGNCPIKGKGTVQSSFAFAERFHWHSFELKNQEKRRKLADEKNAWVFLLGVSFDELTVFIACYVYRTLRSKRTKAQKLECDPPNVSISAKAIKTWTVHRHVYFTAECWHSVGQSVGQSVSFQPLYRLTESQTLKSDAHLVI